MQTNTPIRIALLVIVVAGVAYSLGYQRGSFTARTSARFSIEPKVLFRVNRNDIGNFRATGDVVISAPERRR